MEATHGHDNTRRGGTWRRAYWVAAGIILLIPLIAMQFTTEVAWDVTDFVVAGTMLLVAGATIELAARMTVNRAYQFGVGLAVLATVLLFWVNGAVGIIGNESNDANQIFFGVVLVGLIGAVIGRFQPEGMARAMIATAIAQFLVFVIAFIAGWGFIGPITVIFVALWLGSAHLFRQAARDAAVVSAES